MKRQPSAKKRIPRKGGGHKVSKQLERILDTAQENLEVKKGSGSLKKGNQIWRLRGQGRRPDFTPDGLWEEFLKYAQWCDDNPWVETDYRGSGDTLEKIELPHTTIYTVEGFTLWIDRSHSYLDNLKSAKTFDFLGVLEAIRTSCKTQHIAGAAAGQLNSNIVQRLHNLADNINLNQDVKISNAFPTEDELDNHTT